MELAELTPAAGMRTHTTQLLPCADFLAGTHTHTHIQTGNRTDHCNFGCVLALLPRAAMVNACMVVTASCSHVRRACMVPRMCMNDSDHVKWMAA